MAAFLAAERMEDEAGIAEAGDKRILKVFEERNTRIEKDNEFHDKIFQSTRNAKLIHIAHGSMSRYSGSGSCFQSTIHRRHWTEHQAIQAIAKRDGQKARELAQYHVRMLARCDQGS